MAAEVHRRHEKVNLPNTIFSAPHSHTSAFYADMVIYDASVRQQKERLRRCYTHFGHLSAMSRMLHDALFPRSHPKVRWSENERRQRALQASRDIKEAAEATLRVLAGEKGIPLPAGRPLIWSSANIEPLCLCVGGRADLLPSDADFRQIFRWVLDVKNAISPVHRRKAKDKYRFRDVRRRISEAATCLIWIAEDAEKLEKSLSTASGR